MQLTKLEVGTYRAYVGLTVLLWANGRCMIWVFACPDTLATSRLNRSCYLPALRLTKRGWTSESDEVSLTVGSIHLRASGGRVTWRAGRGGVCLLQQPRIPDHVCDNWDEVIPVPEAAAECRCATWQRLVCVGNCSGFNRTGRTVLYISLNCCYYLFLCV